MMSFGNIMSRDWWCSAMGLTCLCRDTACLSGCQFEAIGRPRQNALISEPLRPLRTDPDDTGVADANHSPPPLRVITGGRDHGDAQ